MSAGDGLGTAETSPRTPECGQGRARRGGEGALARARPAPPPASPVCARPPGPHVRAESAPLAPDARPPLRTGRVARGVAHRAPALQRRVLPEQQLQLVQEAHGGAALRPPPRRGRSSARPAGPAARRASRHRPRGAGLRASGTGSALAPPRGRGDSHSRRPRLKAPRRGRRPLPGRSRSSAPPPEASWSPPSRQALKWRAQEPASKPRPPPVPLRGALLPGTAGLRTAPLRDLPQERSQVAPGPAGALSGYRGGSAPAGHHLCPPLLAEVLLAGLSSACRSQVPVPRGTARLQGVSRPHLGREELSRGWRDHPRKVGTALKASRVKVPAQLGPS